MNTETNSNRAISAQRFIKTFNSFEDLKASNSLNTKLEKTGYEYLNNKYNIDIEKYPQHELKNIYNSFEQNSGVINFINDYKPNKL